MGDTTNIEWCDRTFNPFIGCTKVGLGCDNCYAEKLMDHRMHKVVWGPGQARVRTSPANWNKPVSWNRRHAKFFAIHGRRQRVFCASLADVFDNAVDPAWRADLFALIEATPHLDWLLLTKRVGNVRDMVPLPWISKPFQHGPDPTNIYPAGWPANVWLGATIVNQAEADRDIPKLLAVPAARRFLSMEPLLGPVDLTGHFYGRAIPCGDCPKDAECGCGWYHRSDIEGEPTIDWVIVGGESGPGARPMHPEWVRSLRDQCAAAGVQFLFKQWGEWHTAAAIASTGEAVFRQFDIHQQWINKASTWVRGGICLDRNGNEMRNGGDMQRASDAGAFPVTIMHRVGKKAAGRLLDGALHDGFPVAP